MLQINKNTMKLFIKRRPGQEKEASSTNEIPLSALKFPDFLVTPELPLDEQRPREGRRMSHSFNDLFELNKEKPHISPMATNERPLSSTIFKHSAFLTPRDLIDSQISQIESYLWPAKDKPNWKARGFFRTNPFGALSLDSCDQILQMDDQWHRLVNNQSPGRLYDVNNTSFNEFLRSTPNASQNGGLTASSACSVECLTSIATPSMKMLRKQQSFEDGATAAIVVVSSVPNNQSNVVPANSNNTQPMSPLIDPVITLTKKSLLPTKHTETPQPPRRHRHGLGQMQMSLKCFGVPSGGIGSMIGGYGFPRNCKMTASTNSLFSTAVISGSSSAPNLRDMIQLNSASPSVLEGFAGVPSIRPLETLHNALSLKQLDAFLEKMTAAPSSPPKYPSTQTLTAVSDKEVIPSAMSSCWSTTSSMISGVSSEEPSSPNFSETHSRDEASTSNQDSVGGVYGLNEENLTKMLFNENLNLFPPYFQYENPGSQPIPATSAQTPSNPNLENNLLNIQKRNSSADLTPASSEFEFCTNDATKGSDEDDEDQTISEIFPSFESFPSLDRDFGSKSTNVSMDTQDSKESPTGDEAGVQMAASTSKIDNKLHSKIQKQISLIEKDFSTQNKNLSLSHDLTKFQSELAFNLKPDQNNQNNQNMQKSIQDGDKIFNQAPRFISAEDLEKFTPTHEKNLSCLLKGSNEKCQKAKSCVNLQSGSQETPTFLNNFLPNYRLTGNSTSAGNFNIAAITGSLSNNLSNNLEDGAAAVEDKRMNITNYQASTSSGSMDLSRPEKKSNNFEQKEKNKNATRFTTTFVSED